MFDILLSFVKQNQIALLSIYIKELEKNNGVMSVIQDNAKADVRFYTPEKIPFEDIKKSYDEKVAFFAKNIDHLELTDKWIVNLPLVDKSHFIEKLKDKPYPIWYLILDDGYYQSLFIGIPQENGENKDNISYTLVAEPNKNMLINYYWIDELKTKGQRYFRTCYNAVNNDLNYLVFRSQKEITDIINKFTIENVDECYSYLVDKYKRFLIGLGKIDKIGMPFPVRDGFSLEFWRNLYFVNEMQRHYPKKTVKTMVEFGGGYGHLAWIICKIYKPERYIFIETKYCLDLAKKIHKEIGLEIEYVESKKFIDEKETIPESDLFISAYGYCELTSNGKELYSHVIDSCKDIFMLVREGEIYDNNNLNIKEELKEVNVEDKISMKSEEEYNTSYFKKLKSVSYSPVNHKNLRFITSRYKRDCD